MDSLNFDLATTPLRDLNQFLHHEAKTGKVKQVAVLNPDGAHNIAVGLDCPVEVEVHGHAGYYAGGMNKTATVTILGASAHGGLLVIDGDAGLRCGISLKGGDIVVGGSVGSFSAFMAQAGRMVICGDAGDALGDSLYEAVLYVRGSIKSLGADAQVEPMSEADLATVAELLGRAGISHDPAEFKRIASRRELYHWNADANQEY
jgi:glutamate synthase domain-containing protein 3